MLNSISGTANAINALGQVIGSSGNKSYFYTAGVATRLDALQDINSQAFGVNDKGDIVGQYRKGQLDQAFLYRSGELIEIAPNLSTSVALNINNHGHVVGYFINPQGVEVAFYYDGNLLPLGTLDNGSHSRAYAINDSDEIVGIAMDAQGISRAVQFKEGLIEPLPLGNDNQFSEARDINQHGHIVGVARLENIEQAFVLADGQVTYLGTLEAEKSIAHAINADGHIVGNINNIDNKSPMAFIYTPEMGMTDLNTLIPHYTTLSIARDINDRGQIAVDFSRIDRPQQNAKHIATITPISGRRNQQFGYRIAKYNDKEFFIDSNEFSELFSLYQYNNPLDIPELPFPLDHLSEGNRINRTWEIHDNTMVIGFRNLNCCGEVYVFVRQDNVWQANGKLLPPDDLKDKSYFGSAIGLSKDTLVVSALNGDNNSSVYFYQRNEANTWVLHHILTAPQPTTNVNFGNQLVIDNDQLVISDKNNFYFYQQTATTWEATPYYQIKKDDQWSQLLLQDDIFVVGYPSSISSHQRIIKLYQRTGNTWNQEASLRASTGKNWDSFSASLVLQNNHLFVGAPGGESQKVSGSVYHFQKIGTSWIEVGKILPPDPTQYTRFSQSLVIANNLLIVGAPGDYHLGLQTGVTHIYNLHLNQQTLDIGLSISSLPEVSVNFTVATVYPSLKITHPTPDQALVYDPSTNHNATIELENWLLQPDGMHADWVLNGDTEAEQSGHLHALEPIVLGALSVGAHTLGVRLVNAEHEPTPYQSLVRFEVHELPPILTINQPQADQNIAITAGNPLRIELSTEHWHMTPEGRRYRWQWDGKYEGEANDLALNLSEKLPPEALTDGPHTLIITLINADGSDQATQASVTFTMSHPVDLSLDLAFASEQAQRGDPLTLNVTVSNLSQQNPAADVKVTVPIPPSTTYRSSSNDCQHDDSPNQVQCTIPQLLAQSQQTIAIELLLNTAEEITAKASIDHDRSTQQAQTSILSQDPIDLSVETFVTPASDRHPFNAPPQVTFRLSNRHQQHQANQIELHITLPDPLQVQGDYSPCLYNPDQRRLTCPMESLAANDQHDILLTFIPDKATQDPVTLQAEVTHRSTQTEINPPDNQTNMTLNFYQPSLTIIQPEAEETMELAGPETVQLLFKVEQWLFDPRQTVQLRLNDQLLREFKSTDVDQGTIRDSISGLSTGTHQLALVLKQNDERLMDTVQSVTFHLNYATTPELPSLAILTPDDQSILYIDSNRNIKVDYRIEHWQHKEHVPHRWFLVEQHNDNDTEEKPQAIQYHKVDKPTALQFTQNDLTLDTTYTLTIELTDINGVPTGISDQVTFTVKKTIDTPPTNTSKKSGGQLQFSGLLLLLLWLLGCRFHCEISISKRCHSNTGDKSRI